MRAGESNSRSYNAHRRRGFAMVMLLAAIGVLSAGLALIGPMWSQDAQREREEELLRIGVLYARAIADYHASSPGNVRRFPPDLESLVEDKRFIGTQRHLRRLYPDPFDPRRPWGLLRTTDGGVVGVFSTSPLQPLRATAISLGTVELPAARRYSDWQFIPKVKS